MNELEVAVALLLQLSIEGADQVEEDELKALLFTIGNRVKSQGEYRKTFRGTHALEQQLALEQGREPVLISYVEYLTPTIREINADNS